MNKIILGLLALSVLLNACKDDEESITNQTNDGHIKYFGFTLVDTYWDDTTDTERKTNYSDEVYSFCNMADILVAFPNQDISSNLSIMSSFDMKAILHLNEIFFKIVGSGENSGADYDLRKDYKERWDSFMTINSLTSKADQIQALYIGEEPTWNNITSSEFKQACDYAKQTLPSVPIFLVEAYPIIDKLEIPSSVDWVGFDRYFVKNPKNNALFLKDLATLKSKMNNEQKLVFIMDTHYIDWAHGDFGGISIEEMKGVAISYYQLAISEPKTIGILGYFWPNGFDIEGSIGARGMPQSVKNEYIRIGKEISGK